MREQGGSRLKVMSKGKLGKVKIERRRGIGGRSEEGKQRDEERREGRKV